MRSQIWRWTLGLIYIVAVASIWIAASYVVQSVVDEGVSPFIITYICNSLFIVYIPLFEIGRYLEDTCGSICFWKKKNSCISQELKNSEEAVFIEKRDFSTKFDGSNSGGPLKDIQFCQQLGANDLDVSDELESILFGQLEVSRDSINQVDSQGRWTRTRMARVSLLICPFWFLAQLSFNFSLKYTTVTSNTILSSASSLFTYLVSLAFLGEKFTWMKLVSVLLCMGGTIIVSLGDSSAVNSVAKNPVLGDILALLSAALYAVYITLIRKKLPDDDENSSKASMAQFLGYMGVFNLLIFLPVALILNFTKLEPFDVLNWEEFGLIVGKGLLDNVLSDYLWAKAVLLTTTTVATAGLTIQVPLAAMVDTLTGNAPNIIDYVGAAVVMVGFAGINIPSDAFCKAKEASIGL